MPGLVISHPDIQLFKLIRILFLPYYLCVHCYHDGVILLKHSVFGIVFAFNLC